jgi:radical SAM superfamily enzyme YgiQ (UPF0313 family)
MLIYLAQLTHETHGVNQNKCFPLAAGFVGAYLKREFGDAVEVEVFKSPHELSEAFARRRPAVLMLSNYMWNSRLTLGVAREARAADDDLLIVVGGPDIGMDPTERVRMLSEHPEVDVYVLHEGEVVAKEIVRTFMETGSRHDVRRLSHRSIVTVMDGDVQGADGGADRGTRIGVKAELGSLDDIPSPYLTGLFDKFFRDGEIPLIETNRGCPFSCSFCQQGEDYYSKVVHFSTERVREEILYIAKKVHDGKIDTYAIEIADPNFGMFQRDREVCQAIREAQDRYDFPRYVGCSTGKNRADLIIENTALLQPGTIMLRSAVQSMDDATLEAIRRKNIKLEAYHTIQREMDARGLENNADLMLGLPLETKASHFKAIFDLVDIGVREFACLQTIVLRGTALESKAYREKYGIQTRFRFIPECAGEYEILGQKRKICEVEEIIVRTSTMPFEDYLECRKLHLLTMIFHNTRMLTIVYDLFRDEGLKPSTVLRQLYASSHPGLGDLLAAFVEETKSEVFDRAESADFDYGVDEAISHNKIFKHLSIALFEHKDIVFDALKETLSEILGVSSRSEIDEIASVLSAGVISPFSETAGQAFDLQSRRLRRLFGPQLELHLSDGQAATLRLMNRIYQTREDKINQMAYRLRPANLMLKVRMETPPEGAVAARGPWQDLHR